jgi:hypothetical protein
MAGCDVGIFFVYCEWLWIAAFFEHPPGGSCCVQDYMVLMYYEELLRGQLNDRPILSSQRALHINKLATG